MLILSPPMDVVSARMLFLDLLQNLVFNFHWINLWTASQTGFYETRIAYYSWRGYEGYSYSRIPSYWRIIKEEHKGSPFWLCQGMGSTDWTTSAHQGAKKWYPCVYFNALYCFWSSLAIALWSECQNLSVYSTSTEMMFLIWTMFFSYGSLRNFFSLSPVLGSVVLELYKAVFGLQFQSEGNPFCLIWRECCFCPFSCFLKVML